MTASEVAPDLWCLRNRGFASNTWVARLADGSALVVDPGLDGDGLGELLEALTLRPSLVCCTHGHFDHIAGVARLKASFGASLRIMAAERKVVQTANFTMMVCKVSGRIEIPRFDVEVEDGHVEPWGGDVVQWTHTPGHTPGSAFVRWRDRVFTGDTLYRDGVGLVQFPGESPDLLRDSILKIWDTLPDTSLICPGHGRPGAFGTIKRENTALRAFLGLAPTPAPG